MKIILNRSGMTILETIIVLIIGGLIISGIWVTYSEMSLNDKIRRTQTAITKTAMVVRDFMSARTQFPANFSTTLHNQNLMPSELTFDAVNANTANYISPLNQRFYTNPVTQGALAHRAFYMHIAVKNNSQECARLLPKLIGNNRLIAEYGIIGYNVGSISRGAPYGDPPPLEAPTPQEVLTICGGNTTFIGLHFAVRP